MRRVLFCCTILAFVALSVHANASAANPPASEAEAVRIVLTANPIPADIFAQSFLAQVPASQITPIRDRATAGLGAFQRVEGANGEYLAHYTHGTIKVLIHLDAQNKIDGLLLREAAIAGGSLPDALKTFDALPGDVAYLVLQDKKTLAARNDSRALGVGSAFKLAVLNALRRQIDSGKRHWSDVVQLQPQWKSFPSGVLQTWPDGSPITLDTLATEMISISDNTAADALNRIVGQTALEPFAARNTPFLTTREMFLLKSKENEALRKRWRDGDANERRAALAALDKQPLPEIADIDTSPSLSDIEWHFSPRDLCGLMEGVRDLPLMGVNPGLASPSQWKRIAYKGGSDWGVISLTTWLESKSGRTYCVSAIWNDRNSQVDESRFEAAYTALLGALASGGP